MLGNNRAVGAVVGVVGAVIGGAVMPPCHNPASSSRRRIDASNGL